MIKGITIKIIKKTQTGYDWANAPVYEESEEEVSNVLVGEPSADDVINTLNLHGKHVAYMLAIPKGDTHDWTDTEVILPPPFSGRFRTIGEATVGIEENIPLMWNKKVKVERYGGKD